MPEKITITVPDNIVPDLKRLAREKGCSEEEMLLDAMKRSVVILRLDRLRAEMVPRAQKMGIYTDQDVFDLVS